MSKKRLVTTNKRGRGNKAFSPKHNDRNFDLDSAPHINAEASGKNLTWNIFKQDITFEETEDKYYKTHFQPYVDYINERRRAQRHPERVQSVDDYRRSMRTCPEETIIQIGKMGDTIKPELLAEIMNKQLKWERKEFPNFIILDVALHVDEATPHVQKRGVWLAHDDQGMEMVNQSRALQEMGVEPPNPEERISRYNNPKITYTKQCRNHLAQICIEHGLDMELTPRDKSKSGLSLIAYQAKQEQQKADLARAELKKTEELISKKEAQLMDEAISTSRFSKKKLITEDEYERLRDTVKQAADDRKKADKKEIELAKKEAELDKSYKEMHTLKAELKKREKKVREREKDMDAIDEKIYEKAMDYVDKVLLEDYKADKELFRKTGVKKFLKMFKDPKDLTRTLWERFKDWRKDMLRKIAEKAKDKAKDDLGIGL